MWAREGITLRSAYDKYLRHRTRWLVVFALISTRATPVHPQDPTTSITPQSTAKSTETTPQQAKTDEPKPELSSKDTETTFKLRVNLIQVKVVIRDEKGQPVKDLKREDFQVFDQGKLQVITTFGVETPETRKKKGRTPRRRNRARKVPLGQRLHFQSGLSLSSSTISTCVWTMPLLFGPMRRN